MSKFNTYLSLVFLLGMFIVMGYFAILSWFYPEKHIERTKEIREKWGSAPAWATDHALLGIAMMMCPIALVLMLIMLIYLIGYLLGGSG